jgi:hypothetical protein
MPEPLTDAEIDAMEQHATAMPDLTRVDGTGEAWGPALTHDGNPDTEHPTIAIDHLYAGADGLAAMLISARPTLVALVAEVRRLRAELAAVHAIPTALLERAAHHRALIEKRQTWPSTRVWHQAWAEGMAHGLERAALLIKQAWCDHAWSANDDGSGCLYATSERCEWCDAVRDMPADRRAFADRLLREGLPPFPEGQDVP